MTGTTFEFRFFEDDGTTPRTIDPDVAEIIRAALQRLAQTVASEVGMSTYPAVTISRPEGNPDD